MSKQPPQQLQHGAPDEQQRSVGYLHEPVLLANVVELLAPVKGESYLDLTAGYGGHASAIIRRTEAPNRAVLVDRDQNAINELGSLKAAGTRLIHDDFAHAAEMLAANNERFDMVLLDVGVSSPQLDRHERGFSFQADGPLDMRMDQRMERTAADIVNRSSRDELVDVLLRYGEEPLGQARRIVQAIIDHRPITTTAQLAQAILSTHRGKWQKIHPATRTFQALRVAVNDELGQLERTLRLLPNLLNDEGRVAVISFHSLEDRLVKRAFAEMAGAGYEAELSLMTKKPIAGSTNDVHNPRARSAKLRAAVKINRKGA